MSNKVLAKSIFDSNGNYNTSFYSLDNNFNVIASHPANVSPIANVNFNVSSDNINSFTYYRIANLKLGTLNLTKGSGDTLFYDSNNLSAGPGQFIYMNKFYILQ